MATSDYKNALTNMRNFILGGGYVAGTMAGKDVDPKTGNTRYTETGTPLDTENAVKMWLQENPHFVQAGPAGSGSQSNQSPEGVKTDVDINKLDLKDPKQRELYAQMRKKIYPNVL